ncbi:MAG: hypothetical protein R3B89_35135 [Polyangiaceae bacterium]
MRKAPWTRTPGFRFNCKRETRTASACEPGDALLAARQYKTAAKSSLDAYTVAKSFLEAFTT